MISNTAKILLSFAGGAVIGGVVGFVAGSLMTAKQIQKMMDEEVESKKTEESPMFELSEETRKSILESRKRNKTKEEFVPVDYSSARKLNPRPDLDELVRKYKPENEEKKFPRVITEEEYHETCPSYTKAPLTYYESDKVFTNDQDEIVDNFKNLIGLECLDKFGEGSNDSDIVFVRNDSIATDFEITRVHSSYSQIVGLDEEEEPQPKKRKNRRTKNGPPINEDE